ncbi:PH domain-containing protein [Qipengyuania sp. RANM35]|uniref:PH domain-containing protein n=1 Tax=Qipengyuania sp. RANM35 TaxID=3068635 RepID=UPI0034DB665C
MRDVSTDQPMRTDPRTFAVKAATMLTQLVVPIAFASATIFDKGDVGDWALYFLPIVVTVVGANFAIAYLRWTRLTYAVRESDIRVESGLLSRTARSVPYERIQDVSLEQKFIPRLFGLTEVKFETGASGGDDLKLAYLSETEGERLRELVRARRDGGAALVDAEAEQVEEPTELLFAMSPKRVLTFGLFEFSLAVVAVVFGAAQQFDFLLPFEIWDVRAWRNALSGPGHWLAELGFAAQALAAIAATISLLLVGTVTGVTRTALREWGFRLERTAKGLRRRRGMFTRTDVVMPVHRVQALTVKTGFIRRLFGWHALGVVSLASDSASANHEAAPFAQMEEIAPIVETTGFALPGESLQWAGRSAKASFDAAVLDFAILGLVAIPVAMFSPWQWAALLPLGAGVFSAVRQYYLHRFDRHAMTGRYLYSRHGWLAPKLTIGSRTKLQSVEIVQGPIARRRGYAKLSLGLAGGHFAIEAVDVDHAREWRRVILASIATTDFSELSEGASPEILSGA